MKKILFIFAILPIHVYATQYMVVGGGYEPDHSEASLESNVQTFIKLVPESSDLSIFFGAGNDENIKDVIEQNPNIQKYDDIFFDLLNIDEPIRYQSDYRHNEIENLDGAATRGELVSKFDEIIQDRTKENDIDASPFRFYFTGHGANDSMGRGTNNLNFMALWGDRDMNVKDFTEILDKFPPNMASISLMVQCYSGGFGQMIYTGGKVDLTKLSPANRCGFFSQIGSETSTGCTAEVFSNNGYSRYFFEAYEKANRGNMEADYNRNGVVGSNEANAYVIIHSPNEDKPMATSYELILDFITIEQPSGWKAYYNALWKDILPKLSSPEIQIVESLSKKVEIDFAHSELPSKTVIANAYLDLMKQQKDLYSKYKSTIDKYDSLKKKVTLNLQGKYPLAFLQSEMILDEDQRKSAEQQFSEVVETLKIDERFGTLQTQYSQVEMYDHESALIDQKAAYLERIEMLVDEALIRQMFEKPKYEKFKAKYEQLKNCESQPFFLAD